MKSNVKNDFVLPILVLCVICLVTSTALAFTEKATTPIIEAAAAAAAEAARLEVLPGATSFEQVILEPMPEGVTAMYKAENGYTVEVDVKGYAGVMTVIAGIDNDGKIVKTKTLNHSETAGLGSKTAEEPFQSQFVGKDSSLEGISTIGGATVSSKAFIGAVEKAFNGVQAAAGETVTNN